MASTEEQAPVNEQPTPTKTTEGEEESIQQNGEETSASGGDQAAADEEIVEEGSLIKAGSEDEGKIFVGGLSWETTSEKLRKYFSTFGTVLDCVIKKDKITKGSRGFGFVLFKDPESVKEVFKQKEHKLDGRTIDPKKAEAPKKVYKLFAGGFSPDTTNEQLKTHFSNFGEIELLERPTEKPSETPRGFCFVTYKTEKAMNEACKDRFQEVEGKRCEVKTAYPQQTRLGRGRQPGQLGAAYYQSAWPQPQWQGGYGGYGDFGFDDYPAYGDYNARMPTGNYYSAYPNYPDNRGWGGYGQGNNMYPQGQQQTQRSMMYGKNYRRGPSNNFKSSY